MSDQEQTTNPGDDPALEGVRAAAEEAVNAGEGSEGLEERVREAVREAIGNGAVTADRVRELVAAAMSGVDAGLAEEGSRGSAAVREALGRLESTAAGAGERLRLAAEESGGRLREFGEGRLEWSRRELGSLAGMFTDAAAEAVRGAGETFGGILRDLTGHARTGVKDTAAEVGETAEGLKEDLETVARSAAEKGRISAATATARVQAVVAGTLGGITEGLEGKGR
ncbi:MAG: DUF6781 family protein [Pseudomonadota bacterium]